MTRAGNNTPLIKKVSNKIPTATVKPNILSRIFLKEKLSTQHYIFVVIVLIGIALLGIADEL
ncbi:hypothetical protein [Caldifermentibacillus hisashii]|uniref:hypothetical protein n=1 Tax=Caldifermentibacillus hisashii TaxID=996558 RepID=UPI003D1D00B0